MTINFHIKLDLLTPAKYRPNPSNRIASKKHEASQLVRQAQFFTEREFYRDNRGYLISYIVSCGN